MLSIQNQLSGNCIFGPFCSFGLVEKAGIDLLFPDRDSWKTAQVGKKDERHLCVVIEGFAAEKDID